MVLCKNPRLKAAFFVLAAFIAAGVQAGKLANQAGSARVKPAIAPSETYPELLENPAGAAGVNLNPQKVAD